MIRNRRYFEFIASLVRRVLRAEGVMVVALDSEGTAVFAEMDEARKPALLNALLRVSAQLVVDGVRGDGVVVENDDDAKPDQPVVH